jgi:2'-hydroxyisoflavone reductase
MRLLVLGGTAFVGRAIVADALERGHDVTIFSRGRTGQELFPQAARLYGDRDKGDYQSLVGTEWDAVVDVSAYIPRHVGESLDALHGGFERHVFISTGSVYDPAKAPSNGLDERAPRLPGERGTEEVTGETYGGLKVACEDDLMARLGVASTIVRPGIVAGPHDPTDRFTWWARVASLGGEVHVPVRPDQPVQVVDSRDLARLVVRLVEDDRPGVFNAVGPREAVTIAGLLAACAEAAGTTARLVPDSVADAGSFPLRLPDESWDPMFRRSAARAYAAGMPATPLRQTAADVLAWDRARGFPPLRISD